MLNSVKTHLRRHGVAFVALFVALGGSAVALPGTGTVKTNDIARKAVKAKTIAKHAVRPNKIADGAVGARQADEASFEGVIKGDGRLESTSVVAPGVGFLDPRPELARVPNMGVVELLFCGGGPDYEIRTRLISFDDAAPFNGIGTVTSSQLPSGFGPVAVSDQGGGSFSAGGGNPLRAKGGSAGTAGHFDWSMWRGTGEDSNGAHVVINGWNNAGLGGPVECHVTATTQYYE